MERRAWIISRFGIAVILAAMVVGPGFSHPDYSSFIHTTSELAGQNMPNAWIMRSGLGLYGASTALAALIAFRRAPATCAALILFGTALTGTAIWSHVPIDPSLGSDLAEDRLHSLFSGLTGTAFAIACTARLWSKGWAPSDWAAWAGLFASVGLTAAMSALPEAAGALQRLMFVISFGFAMGQFSQR
ncbi:MAG: DUF998 domain-containing protein [Paracoccaceae bacterium]|nr:DUF998 domain-containing protein [Paracoccaceae bacterium]